MTSTEPAATVDTGQPTVPAPRNAPVQEERPRRRHDGYYWDVGECAWRPCPGS